VSAPVRRRAPWVALLLTLSALGLVPGQVVHAATLPVISVGSASIVEGNTATRVAYVPVTLSAPSSSTVTVNYVVLGGTAVPNVDFKMGSGRLVYSVNTTTGLTGTVRTIPVTVLGDTARESNETVTVRLWNPIGGVLGSTVAVSNIVDDDSTTGVAVGVGDVSVFRSASGNYAIAKLPVILSRASSTTVSVQYAVTGIGATGSDYSGPGSGRLDFLSPQVAKYLTFRIYASASVSPFRIAVALSSPVGASVVRVGGSVNVSPPPAAAQAATPSLYWGAWIGKQFTLTPPPWNMKAVDKLETLVGKRLAMIHFSAPFANCAVSPCSFYKFDPVAFNNVEAHGAIPFFSWASQSTPSSTNEPNFQLADVTAGTYDSFIKTWAAAAKAWGHTFFLRFNWEMNGSWFPWSERANNNKAGEYVAAWRHVHQLFADAGATNVSWVWCPNADPNNTLAPISSLYPGDAYVDWTCIDGYNWGGSAWQSFDQVFSNTYNQILTIAPSKPMMLGEVASSEVGGNKAAWISNMLTGLPQNYPSVRGFLWMDKGHAEADGMDWPIESSVTSVSAFGNGIAGGPFADNTYSSRAASPIPPP
jgi:hypothetical protein